MIATRLRQISLLLIAMAISALAFIQMFQRTAGEFPMQYAGMLALVVVLFLVLWGLIVRFQPYASQSILPCVLLLTATGVTMIARIDQSEGWAVAQRQLIWLCIAIVLSALLIIFLKDYRVLRRFSYVSMVVGLVLLLAPMLPFVGQEVNGARIWIRIPGLGQFQPGEFAKLFLAFFFAAYLFDHRDQLAVGGKKMLGLQLPRIKDLGPIIVVWIASMGVLIMQHDLGTSLMFFAMFVAMLYTATGRKSWIIIGLIAFAAGAVLAAGMFSHVGQRVDAWLHPFSNEQYNKTPGGSWQLVTGIFGLASGGMLGTGLGQGHPSLVTFANSDFIYASLGEELGLMGVPGHFDALPAHHCLRLYHRHENQGWLRQAARFRTGVHHGLPSVHRGRRHHAGDSSDRSDPALYGGRRLQSDRQLYSRDPAHHHLELGQCARAGADLGYVPVRGFGRAAQQGT